MAGELLSAPLAGPDHKGKSAMCRTSPGRTPYPADRIYPSQPDRHDALERSVSCRLKLPCKYRLQSRPWPPQNTTAFTSSASTAPLPFGSPQGSCPAASGSPSRARSSAPAMTARPTPRLPPLARSRAALAPTSNPGPRGTPANPHKQPAARRAKGK